MLPVLGVFGLPLLPAQQPIRTRIGGERTLVFPKDPRQFKGWRHSGAPLWSVDPELPNDVFTFARLRFPFSKGGRWTADYPNAELNFSFRLHQNTSLQVNPYPVIIDINAEQLSNHPFVYISEPGWMNISDDQARILRDYMLNGGFLMLDDFWGTDEWNDFAPTLRKIWPDRNYRELEPDHPIFHQVFELPAPPQVHSNVYVEEMRKHGRSRLRNETRSDVKSPHFRAVYDDRERMVMLICLNNDLGDGWEKEGSDPWYFTEVSEKHAYPLGINIVSYVLTH